MNEKQINKSIYNAAVHLLEASKHLRGTEIFEKEAFFFLKMSEAFAELVEPEQQKVSEEKMQSILDEIASFAEDIK